MPRLPPDTHQDKPMAVNTLAFHVTDRCQLDCKHCLRDPAQRPVDLDFDLFVRALDEVTRVYKTKHVALTGGEPTLHPRFLEMTDAIAERDCTWHMVTNGKSFPWLMERFAERPSRRGAMSRVYFSLDGADEATHDKIRGAGSFREVMAATSVCVMHDIPFVLQMVLNAKNESELEAMGMLASQLGAKQLSFAILLPTGTSHDEALFVPSRGWRSLHERMERLASILKIPVTLPEGFPRDRPFHVCTPFTSASLHIDLDGRLNLCCQHSGIPSNGEQDVAGDLHEMSLPKAHHALLKIFHHAQERRLEEVEALGDGPISDWEYFPCNACMKSFGKPYWTDDGAAGPGANRERWRGKWAPRRLPIVA